MKHLLLTYSQKQHIKNLGIEDKCEDFFDLLDILPAAIKVGNIIYELSINKKLYGKSISYSNRFTNYFSISVNEDDWNHAMISMCEKLLNNNYKIGKNFNPMKL